MAAVDIHIAMDTVNAFDVQDISTNTTTVGNIVDSQGAEGLEFVVHSGAIADGDFVAVLEDGNDPALSDAAAVASDFLIGALADIQFTDAADSDAVKKLGYVGKKEYVRLSYVSTSVTGANFIGAVAIKMPLEQKNITA